MSELNVVTTRACHSAYNESSSSRLHSDLHDLNNLKATMSKRTRKMLKSKVMEKLMETKEGRQLLLGRALFKRLKKQQQQQQIKKSNSKNLSSPLSSNNRKKIHQLKDDLVLQYLEHRSLRKLTDEKQRQEDMKKLILQLREEIPSSVEIPSNDESKNENKCESSSTKHMMTKFEDLNVKDQLPLKNLSSPPTFIRSANENFASAIMTPKAA